MYPIVLLCRMLWHSKVLYMEFAGVVLAQRSNAMVDDKEKNRETIWQCHYFILRMTRIKWEESKGKWGAKIPRAVRNVFHSLAKKDPAIIYIINAPDEYEGVGGWGTLGPFVTRGLSCRVVHNCTKTTRAGAYAQLNWHKDYPCIKNTSELNNHGVH